LDSLIDKLLELQKQHAHLHDLREKAHGASVAITAKQRQVNQKKAVLDEVQQTRKRIQMEADAKELEIKTVRAKIDKFRAQLNEVKTNKEYKAIQTEIQFAASEQRRLEDEELATMEKLERFNAEAKKAEEALKLIQKELDAVKAEVAATSGAIQEQIRKAERDRKLIAEQIPSDALAVFERIAAKHSDGAMAPILSDDGRAGTFSCGGCFMQMTQNDYVKLLGDRNTLVTCPSCTRILYVES